MSKHAYRITDTDRELIYLLFYRTNYLPDEVIIDNTDKFIADTLRLNIHTVTHFLWRHLVKVRKEHYDKILKNE